MTLSLTPELKHAIRNDGVAKLEGFLDPQQLDSLRACYEWSIENPGPLAVRDSDGTNTVCVDNANPESLPIYRDVLFEMPFADFVADLWESEHVWYFAEELFMKKGEMPRTYWHQDTSYNPWGGQHWANFWISFCRVPKSNCLEVVRGSHRGPVHNGSTFNPEDPTEPLWPDRNDLPRLPDIEADRADDPNSWDVVSYDMEVGDVLFVHSNSLHGGGASDQHLRERHTLVLRFFGDDAFYTDLPEAEEIPSEDTQKVSCLRNSDLKPGDLYSQSSFLQLR